jgi:hypothetical protein
LFILKCLTRIWWRHTRSLFFLSKIKILRFQNFRKIKIIQCAHITLTRKRARARATYV